MGKILVIAPHADDEVLGCGGTIKKKAREGDEVYVLIMTNAHVGAPELFSENLISRVRGEALKAHVLLGVKQTVFFDFPAPVLDQLSFLQDVFQNNGGIARVFDRYGLFTS